MMMINTGRPCLAVFGDSGEQAVTKTIWSLLAGRDVRILSIDSFAALEESAPNMMMILIVIHSAADPLLEMVRHLSRNQRVTCNIVAITSAIETGDRVHIYASGFDAILDITLMDHKNLQQILLNMLDKGRLRLEHQVMREEYERFKASLSASPDAFIVLDEEGRIFFVSEHYRRAYPKNGDILKRGLPIIDAFDALSTEQGILPGDPRYSQMRKFWERLTGQEEVTFDNGRTWRIKAAPLVGVGGTIISTTDITDYSRQNDILSERSGALEKALEMERESAAIQKQFINMVSHEFRTPLSIIDGNAQILLRRYETLAPETIQQRLTTIRSAVSRLVGMMEGVLSSNMLRTGRIELAAEEFDLRGMVEEMCREYADLSSTHLIECKLKDLPAKIILDKKALTLIMSNLIGNAVKFTRDNPHIIVTGWLEGPEIILSVQDNGVGIPENEIEMVTERFYRATTAGSIPGTGIGLNLVHELMNLHGGRLEIESTLGQGTKITVAFPLFSDLATAEKVLTDAAAP